MAVNAVLDSSTGTDRHFGPARTGHEVLNNSGRNAQ
jgi:hypothetical protein